MDNYATIPMVTLDKLAGHLDRLPLTGAQRAEIFHAWDTAPLIDPRDEPAPTLDVYFNSEGHAAWCRVRDFKLYNPEGSYYATTLEEASGYTSCPTKDDLLAALARAERMIAA